MLVPIEKLFFKIIYEDKYMNHISFNRRNVERRMGECYLMYRKDKSFYDALDAVWGYESTIVSKNYNKHLEWACERLDKVLTIDWYRYLKAI